MKFLNDTNSTRLPQRIMWGAALLSILWLVAPARAHTGPPYPILMDQPVQDQTVSVWADPDIGTGSFFIIFAGKDGRMPTGASKVQVWVQPVNGRLPKATYDAERDDSGNQLQYVAHPDFDKGEWWRVGIVIEASRGAEPIELSPEPVEATPDGLKPWFLFLYAAPFAIIGAFWIAALRRKWRMTRELEEQEVATKSSKEVGR